MYLTKSEIFHAFVLDFDAFRKVFSDVSGSV